MDEINRNTDRLNVPAAPVAGASDQQSAGSGRSPCIVSREHPQQLISSEELKDPKYYLNRELTWLKFNQRVLYEAQDKHLPLLEQVKFLAITGSNLDEFFMKRIGGLKQQVGAGVHELTVDGRSPQEQIEECLQIVGIMENDMRKCFQSLMRALARKGIELYGPERYGRLTKAQKEVLRTIFREEVFPLITPLAMDPAHPFPHISNLSLNLLVSLQVCEADNIRLVRIKVPIGQSLPRQIRVPGTNKFVGLEALIMENLDVLLPDVDIKSCELFRVIRNASTERNEDQADDLLAMIELELRDRKYAPIVRLEVSEGMDPVHRGMLAAELGLDEAREVYETSTMLGMRDLMEIATLDIPELHHPDHHPVTHERLLEDRSIFHVIRETGPILVQHPYESFATSVERLVHEASIDPKVLAIKMTIYRTSASTLIIQHLVDAAQRGKQVTVVVELKARFDEEANIRWASRLEEAGIHVTYGVVGLKTHCKTILIVRRDYDGLRRYAHIGTGNYHAGTARIYADVGLLTSDEDIGADLSDLFNFLTTGCQPPKSFRTILTTPKVLKKELIARIEREARLAEVGKEAFICFKCNALEDAGIVRALYKAAQKGVRIELLIRDTCRLIPGIAGLSETITVRSLIGRFLEHARIYHFANDGAEEFFIGSADLMTRNLSSRVEVVTPIRDKSLQQELKYMLDAQIQDRQGAWEMSSDGEYRRLKPTGRKHKRSSQEALIKRAAKRESAANKALRLKPKGIARRASK